MGYLDPKSPKYRYAVCPGAVDHGQKPVLQEVPLGHLFPEQIQCESQDRVHDRLWMIETHVADQPSWEHLLFVHVL